MHLPLPPSSSPPIPPVHFVSHSIATTRHLRVLCGHVAQNGELGLQDGPQNTRKPFSIVSQSPVIQSVRPFFVHPISGCTTLHAMPWQRPLSGMRIMPVCLTPVNGLFPTCMRIETDNPCKQSSVSLLRLSRITSDEEVLSGR